MTLTLEVTQNNAAIVAEFLTRLYPSGGVCTREDHDKAACVLPSTAPHAQENKVSTEKAISFTDLREAALKLPEDRRSAILKVVFAKYKAAKLSEITPEFFEECLRDLEEASR